MFFSENTMSVLQKSSKIYSVTRCKRKEAWKSLKCSVRSFRMKNHVPKSLVRDRITSEKITRVLTLYLPIVQYLFARHKVHILCNCQHYSDTLKISKFLFYQSAVCVTSLRYQPDQRTFHKPDLVETCLRQGCPGKLPN